MTPAPLAPMHRALVTRHAQHAYRRVLPLCRAAAGTPPVQIAPPPRPTEQLLAGAIGMLKTVVARARPDINSRDSFITFVVDRLSAELPANDQLVLELETWRLAHGIL
jgi:hypothetical protein